MEGAQLNIFAKALQAMRHGAGLWWFGGWAGSRRRYKYEKEVGLGLDASVVMAPVRWLQRNIPVAPIVVDRLRGKGSRVPDHPLALLMRRPNPGYSGSLLLQATVFSLAIAGNGYWIKVRNGVGKVVEVWYAPHWLVKPRWPDDGKVFISHYEYTPGGEPVRLELEDVVHFRVGIDPANTRLGLSPLRPVLREIWSDMEIGTFVAALLRNSGIPGLIISPDGPVAAKPGDVDGVKRYLREQFTGENRGEALVMSAKTHVERLGFNPKELDLTAASDRAEERVCALLGVPAVVVGFHAGTDQTSVGATMREQVKLGWHNGVIPLQSVIADAIAHSLLPDLEKNPAKHAVYFDNSEVEALSDEEDKLVARSERLFRSGIITQAEARQIVGLEADQRHEIYLRPFGLVEVDAATNRAPDQEPRLLAAPPGGAKVAKHTHSSFEERIAASAPHGEPGPELEAFLAEVESYALAASRHFEKILHAFFLDLGELAGELARPVLEQELKTEALNLLVTDRVIEAMALPEKNRLFREHYERHYIDVAQGVARAGARVGLGTDLPDRVGRAVIATGGRRAGLVDLDAQTRDRILREVAQGRAEGAGPEEIARRIAEGVPSGPWSDPRVRARVIARTETKNAQNVSVLEHSRANGVEKFMVFDARLGETDEVCAALDGAIVTADEARALVEAEHPNGTRSITPYFG